MILNLKIVNVAFTQIFINIICRGIMVSKEELKNLELKRKGNIYVKSHNVELYHSLFFFLSLFVLEIDTAYCFRQNHNSPLEIAFYCSRIEIRG
jgi:hypothetical protein